ncbi:MAG: iron-containing alcohol dehydrogenase [Thermoleophilia bacterium]
MSTDLELLFNTPALQRFAFPGTVLWGVGCRERTLDLLGREASVALWVDAYFAHSAFIDEVRAALGSRLLLTSVVTAMPRTAEIGAAMDAGADAVDAVLAVGGGSTVDAAKAVIAQRLYGTYDGVGMGERRGLSPLDGERKPLFICLPTTAGTGAEASRYYVTYDSRNGAKVHGKSWRLLADWVLLDPSFLEDAPASLLVGSAFDAFTHCWESFLCREERSWFNEMLSLEGMCRAMSALQAVVRGGDRSSSRRLELLYAATIGGMAISNVRTGDIHEAAGALLERSGLTHPETLFVFFRAAVEHHRPALADREARLLSELGLRAPELGLVKLDDLVGWWEGLFAETGLRDGIVEGLGRVALPPGELESHIYERVRADRVWADKEAPVPLRDGDIESLINRSLRRFGYDVTGR